MLDVVCPEVLYCHGLETVEERVIVQADQVIWATLENKMVIFKPCSAKFINEKITNETNEKFTNDTDEKKYAAVV